MMESGIRKSAMFLRIAVAIVVAFVFCGTVVFASNLSGTLVAKVMSAGLSGSALPESGAFGCEGAARGVRSGDLIILSAGYRGRGVPRVTYQLYNDDGIWTYPVTSAVTVLRVPASVHEPFVIATRPCAPAVAMLPGEPPRPDARIYEAVGHVPNPVSCAQPFAAARALEIAKPALPEIVRAQNRSGFVEVGVLLDAAGHVTSAGVGSDSLPWLTGNATAAARDTTYSPAVFRCEPIPSYVRYRVDYVPD